MPTILLIQVSQTTAEDLCAGAVPDAESEVVTAHAAEERCRRQPMPAAAVLGPWLPEPVALAQRLRGVDEDLALVLLAEPSRLPALAQAVRFAPYLGGDVRCLPADDLDHLCAELAEALEATVRRRRHRGHLAAVQGAGPSAPAERSGRRYFGRVLGEAPVGIVAVDPGGSVVGTNRRAGELLGGAESELLGQSIADHFPGSQADTWRRLLAPRRFDEPARSELLELPGGAGETRYLEASASPYPVLAGEAGVLVFFTDVTDRVLAERERQRLLDSLAETARFREQFLGILGHDLRTPLQVVTLASHLLQDTELDERQRRYVDRIASAGERMRAMVQDLLDFTRARLGGGLPLSPREADLGALARQVCDEQEAAHPDRHVEVETEGDVCGWWDPDRLYQLLSNLVGNALRYSLPETPAEIRVRGDGDVVSLSVHNQGEPIPPERLESIFDPFRRATDRNPSEGLGLGLFIVDQIVRAHRGTLEVTSTAEEGTTFEARLPRRAPEAEPPDEEPPAGA